MMYAAEFNTFPSSNLGLWSAYCSCALALDSLKEPSVLISDILHVGELESIPRSSAIMTHLGSRAPVCSAGSPIPTESSFQQVLAPSTTLRFGIDRILSTDFNRKAEETLTLREHQSRAHISTHPSSDPYLTSLGFGITNSFPIMNPLLNSTSQPAQHQLQDTFSGPYAVLTKDTIPQSYKRKRSWSRAVFSNLQRKGLEKRFETQKYVTKPDRKQLAAMLGLTDAQVKVWFQNRRMKWRHSKEAEASTDIGPLNESLTTGPEADQKERESESESESEFQDGQNNRGSDASENRLMPRSASLSPGEAASSESMSSETTISSQILFGGTSAFLAISKTVTQKI